MNNSWKIAPILTFKDKEKYKHIIERAANNGYHDFKFDSVPGHPEYAECVGPKTQLIEDLSIYPELSELTAAVYAGDFDDEPDEVDNFNLAVEMLNEGTELLKLFPTSDSIQKAREMIKNANQN